jgi:hypothetical protein
LSPENERATKVAPSCSAIATRSIELSELVTPRLDFGAAVGGGGELALGEAVHAVVLHDVDHVDARRSACANWPSPMEAESPSPDTPR